MVAPSPRNVLLVEDNDDHAQLMLRQLRRTDAEARVVRLHDGAEALDYLRKLCGEGVSEAASGGQPGSAETNSRWPNLILLDLHMPRLDGLGLLAWLKADHELRIIPVIMLTSSDAESDRLQAYRSFVNGYLVKPSDSGGYRSLTEAMVGFWHHCNRVP